MISASQRHPGWTPLPPEVAGLARSILRRGAPVRGRHRAPSAPVPSGSLRRGLERAHRGTGFELARARSHLESGYHVLRIVHPEPGGERRLRRIRSERCRAAPGSPTRCTVGGTGVGIGRAVARGAISRGGRAGARGGAQAGAVAPTWRDPRPAARPTRRGPCGRASRRSEIRLMGAAPVARSSSSESPSSIARAVRLGGAEAERRPARRPRERLLRRRRPRRQRSAASDASSPERRSTDAE